MQVCGLLELFIAESLAVIERVREEERWIWFNNKNMNNITQFQTIFPGDINCGVVVLTFTKVTKKQSS